MTFPGTNICGPGSLALIPDSTPGFWTVLVKRMRAPHILLFMAYFQLVCEVDVPNLTVS
jgi:hypothetical protein